MCVEQEFNPLAAAYIFPDISRRKKQRITATYHLTPKY